MKNWNRCINDVVVDNVILPEGMDFIEKDFFFEEVVIKDGKVKLDYPEKEEMLYVKQAAEKDDKLSKLVKDWEEMSKKEDEKFLKMIKEWSKKGILPKDCYGTIFYNIEDRCFNIIGDLKVKDYSLDDSKGINHIDYIIKIDN